MPGSHPFAFANTHSPIPPSPPTTRITGTDYRPEILRAIGDALAVYYSNSSEANFLLYQSSYPTIAKASDCALNSKHRFPGLFSDMSSSSLPSPSPAVRDFGGLFFYCGGMFFFIILLYQIGTLARSSKKKNRLKTAIEQCSRRSTS